LPYKSTPAHVINPCLARDEEIIGRGVGGVVLKNMKHGYSKIN